VTLGVRTSAHGTFLPRRSSTFESVIGGMAAAPGHSPGGLFGGKWPTSNMARSGSGSPALRPAL
jgi:hypothetical protein